MDAVAEFSETWLFKLLKLIRVVIDDGDLMSTYVKQIEKATTRIASIGTMKYLDGRWTSESKTSNTVKPVL